MSDIRVPSTVKSSMMSDFRRFRKSKRWLLGLERETGFEPATPCLEGRNSTAELLPLLYSLSIIFIAKSRVGKIIGNESKMNLPQNLPHLEPNRVSEFRLLHQ